MRVFQPRVLLHIVALALPALGLHSATAHAQESQPVYELAIADVVYQKVERNWLYLPKSVDLNVHWTATTKDENGEHQDLVGDNLSYKVLAYESKTGSPYAEVIATKGNSAGINAIPVGTELFLKVQALDAGGGILVESDRATLVIGKGGESGAPMLGHNWPYYLHPGRWQLAVVGKAQIYDHSTMLGKVAFVFLSVTGALSLFVFFFYSSRTLYLGNIFPFKRASEGLAYSLSMSCDVSYEKRLTEKFKFILDAWEMIAVKSKVIADKAVKTIPAELSSTEKMASVDVACMEYWSSDGDRAIGTIEDIIAFPEYKMNGKPKTTDDVLTELVVKIEDNFHELVMPNGNGHPQACKHNMERLIDEIYSPVVADEKPFARFRKWCLRKGVMDLKRGLRPFPTSRIIHAGLEIHRMNGHRWSKPTEEVKRAFEDRASSEIEILKRKSRIEWFWNYGALAPLVGLFGTVTGITFAFQQLATSSVTEDFSKTLQLLSNGIFEALWTTIFGLANGILFVIIYYYFKHKLDWIYSKWEEIYVSITEQL